MTMALPDDFDAAAFDRANGGDDDEGRAKEAMAYAVAELAKMEAIRTILREARADILAVGEVQEWLGNTNYKDIMFDLDAAIEFNADEERDLIFANKMDELEART